MSETTNKTTKPESMHNHVALLKSPTTGGKGTRTNTSIDAVDAQKAVDDRAKDKKSVLKNDVIQPVITNVNLPVYTRRSRTRPGDFSRARAHIPV